MRQLLVLLTACLAFLLGVNAGRAFTYQNAPRTMLDVEVSLTTEWALATVEKGDTLSTYCGRFLAEMGIASRIPQSECWHLIGDVNGLSTQHQLDALAIGQKIWLPTLENRPELIAERLLIRDQLVAGERNFLGRASVVHLHLMGEDELFRFLTVREAALLNKTDVEAIVEQVLRDDYFVTTAQLAAVKAELTDALAAAQNGEGVSSEVVSRMIAEAFARARVPDEATLAALQLTEGKVAALERKLDATVEKIENDLTPGGRVNDMVTVEAERAVTNALANQISADIVPLPGGDENAVLTFVRQNMVAIVILVSVLLGILLLYTLLALLLKRRIRMSSLQVGETVTSRDAHDVVTTAGVNAAAAKTTAAEAMALATETKEKVEELTTRVSTLENHHESDAMLALLQFEQQFGVLPLQAFPTDAQIKALDVNQTMTLVFEQEGTNYALRLLKDENGLYLTGLTGRIKVAVTNAKSVMRTITHALKNALEETGTAASAFRSVTTTKSTAA